LLRLGSLNPSSRTGRNTGRRISALLAVSAVLSLCAACHSLQAGDSVPDFTLPAVRGGSFSLRTPTPQPVLLAFLLTVPDTAPTPSRSVVPMLLSMDRQYRARGLRVAIVDATALATGHAPAHDALINATYDWQLEIPLLQDDGSRVARTLGVTQVPVTLLVALDGRLAQRWNRPPTPGALAVSIEHALGSGPLVPTRPAPR
jgi:peroxiredoxin